MSTRVVNVRSAVYPKIDLGTPESLPENFVYIGRNHPKFPAGSKWANKYIIGRDGTREEVIIKYEKWIMTQRNLLNDLPELIDKDLGCWCWPLACHGDILVKLVERLGRPTR